MAQYKTPGVYIVEKNAFPNSVVEVATAVPAFIGHTRIADHKGASLRNKPWRISSMAEFESYFGGPPVPKFTLGVAAEGVAADFMAPAPVGASMSADQIKTARDAVDAAQTANNNATDANRKDLNKALKDAQAEAARAAYWETVNNVAVAEKGVTDARTTANDATAEGKAAAVAALELAVNAAAKARIAAIGAEAKRAQTGYTLGRQDNAYLLYYSMQLFFQNGGGACYIVSVGDYDTAIDKDLLQAGVDSLLKEQEPTMLVIPEAVRIKADACYSLQQGMLMHCGYQMKNRFAILDVHDGFKELVDQPVDHFRNQVSSPFLAFGAAYYPWVNTTIVAAKDLNFNLLDKDSRTTLTGLLRSDLAVPLSADPDNAGAVKKAKEINDVLAGMATDWHGNDDAAQEVPRIDRTMATISPLYNRIVLAMQRQLNLLPPSAAMAGIYTLVDNTRGVWKAPANAGLASVTAPAVNITHNDQEELNVTTTGKSINAIRSFIGEGTLVWGARTLDGNSLDWRYINVRRTMIMLEESLRLACKAYVFEPNVANTWVTIKSMARNFLTGIWKRGGLAGASPDDAFSVAVGLNETMTSEDILDGILRVTIMVAISRPAEFIEITFQQQMQKS